MKTKDLIAKINDLPIEQRIEIATQILEGLTTPDQEAEKTGPKKPGDVWMNSSKARPKAVLEISLIKRARVEKTFFLNSLLSLTRNMSTYKTFSRFMNINS